MYELKKDDPSVLKAWSVRISFPNKDQEKGWRQNRDLVVYAGTLQAAVNIIEDHYKGARIWHIQHQGLVEPVAEGRVWERTYH